MKISFLVLILGLTGNLMADAAKPKPIPKGKKTAKHVILFNEGYKLQKAKKYEEFLQRNDLEL